MDSTHVDYSTNNNIINNHTNALNNFLAENSNNFVNGERTFNQWTGKHTDSCEYKQRLNLATKPMEYYVNSLNNISGVKQNADFLSFTPVGNAQQVNIRGEFERPIPSTLQQTSSTYTSPYSTSPFLGSSNNINVLDTDNDLNLKTGLGLRPRNNQAHMASQRWPVYGDIHAASIGVTVQNAGQHMNDDKLPRALNKDIPGLNNSPNPIFEGRGIMQLGGVNQVGLSSRNMLRNFQNGPLASCPDYKKYLQNQN